MWKTPSRAAYALTVGMTLLVATTIFAQQFSKQSPNDEITTKLVTSLVTRHHINKRPIDDEISKQLFDTFIEALDPQKLYFTQADIDRFARYRLILDDQVNEGNVSFAYEAFDVYRQRVDENIELAHKLIDVDHDFTVDESVVVDPEELDWAKSHTELVERWRKQIKLGLLNLKLEDTELEEARDRMHKRYRMLQRSVHEIESSEKLEMYLSSLTHCFDPHSSYMSPQTLEEFRISMELSLDGIGAALRSEDGYTIVAQIVPGGAAEKDGRLKVGDRIVAVGQEEGEFVDIVEMKLSKVVRLIRGERGTKVRLRVKAEDTGEIKVYEMTRQKIELKSAAVKGKIIHTDGEEWGLSRTARIGVINIPSFYRDFRGAQNGDDNFKSTARDVEKVLMQFRDSGGVDAIVVDLRNNGGGALSEAIEVSGLFIDQGPVVQVKEQDGEIESHDDLIPGAAYTGPLVVICNRHSASASEIFAGVIKDYGRGIVVGDTTTHGKGTVQNVMPVSRQMFRFINAQDRGALKLTINQFYRVNGDSTQNHGVRSDIVLPSLIDHMDEGEAFLDNALAFDQIRPAQYEPVGMVTPELLSDMRKKSAARVAEDEDFQDLQERIASYLERKNRKTVSLNEAVQRKEQEELKEKLDENGENGENGESEDENDKESDENATPPIFDTNYYNEEVLRVTMDYVEALKGPTTVQKN